MKTWEKFEIECFEFLEKKYGKYFEYKGKSDSTVPDFLFFKDGLNFYIEAKMPNAQSGQFVVFPIDTKKVFKYSEKNKSPHNIYTEKILGYMSQNFDNFTDPNKTVKEIDIDSQVLSSWIINYYKNKGVKFVISIYEESFIIFKIEDLNKFFNITANYRFKKSGSSEVAKKNIDDLSLALDTAGIAEYEINYDDKNKLRLSTDLDIDLNKKTLPGNSRKYYIREHQGDYKVTQLSNTNNGNVIFSINLKDNIPSKLIEENIKGFEDTIN